MVLVPDLDPEIKVPTARHTDSLGGEHRQGERLRGSSSSASRLLRRYTQYHPPPSPCLRPRAIIGALCINIVAVLINRNLSGSFKLRIIYNLAG